MLLGEIKVTDPSQQEGSTQQKLQAMYEYMQQLNKQIRFVLQNIDEDNLSPGLTQTIEGLKENNRGFTSTVTRGDLETLIRQTAEMIEMKASKEYTDPKTGKKIDLWTQVIQTAADITSKADATYTDPATGDVTHLWTQVFQSAEEISQKANAEYTDPVTGKPVNLTTQLIQTASDITQKANKTYKDSNGNTVDLATQVQQTASDITQKANKTYKDSSGKTVDLATQVQQNASDITSKANKTYKDSSGKTVDLATQVQQNASDITTKANKTYKDSSGKTVDLATQVQQNASDITSKANKTYTDANGKTVNLSSQVQQSASEITAIVEGTTPVGALDSTKVTINKTGVAIATGGTFTVDSGNFALDTTGSLTANGAQINGELLNNGKPVLTDADIYVGTVEPKQKKAGMIWIKPVADEEGNESVQTTHTGNYTSGSRQSLRSYPVTVTLTGTPASASSGNYAYELSVPIYFAGDVSSGSVTVTVGGKTFSATVSGSQYSHKTVKLSGTHSTWMGNASSLSVKISASTDNLTSERTGDGYQISMVSRAY